MFAEPHLTGCACSCCLEAASAAADGQESGTLANSNSYDLLNIKWGEKVYGTSSGTITWSFAIPFGQTEYNFDSEITNATEQAVIEAAFDAWEDVAGVDFEYTTNGSNADIILGYDYIDGRDGTVGEATFFFDEDGDSITPGTITYSEIRFDSAENWTTNDTASGSQILLYEVAVHEIGHALGLDHVNDEDQIMNPYVTDQIELGDGDIGGIQFLYGTGFLTFTGTAGANVMDYATSDEPVILLGLAGGDTLIGSAFSDEIYGGRGNDTSSGGGGEDLLVDGFGNDVADGGDDRDVIADFAGTNDLSGGAAGDLILGGYGDDTISGDAGWDVLLGDAFGSLVFGEDVIDGGGGNDLLSGGGGADIFIFETNDGSDHIGSINFDLDDIAASTITGADFEVGLDKIHLSGFTVLGDAALEAEIFQSGNDAVISLQGTTIRFEGIDADELSASDFLFV